MKKSPPPLSPKKKRAFMLVTMLLPLIAVVILELALRVAGYGPDLSLCTKRTVRGVDYYAMNGGVRGRYFSGRFFGGRRIDENTAPEYFVMPKPAGTFRIFCLGGSTTFGYPYGVLGSFSHFLQDRLQHIFPERTIEVVNFGITATNSFTVMDMARDAMEYSPDLIIVYDGHNEFYGALGIGSRESAGRVRGLGLAYMRLTKLKTFLLLNDAVDGIRSLFVSSSGDDLSGTAMERLARGKTIPFGSAMYATGLEWYKENMDETIRICEDSNVPVIFSSQVSNLRDLPPFVSEFAEGTSSAERERFMREMTAGDSAKVDNDLSHALARFREAIAADSTRADAHYRCAQCMEANGDLDGARYEYRKARDLDQLRFRQSADFNQAVLNLHGKDVFVSDCEKAFEQESPHRLIGTNLILEHLHPTLNGYFLLAKCYARTMKDHGLLAPAAEWSKRDTVSDAVLWNGKIVSPLDEAIGARRIAILTSSWPFVPDGAAAGAGLMKQAVPKDPIGRIAKDVVDRTITWERGMVTAAEHFASQGKINEAASCYRSLMVHTPFNASPYLRLGGLLIGQGKDSEGVRVITQSIAADPTHLAYQLLGRVAYTHERFDEAVRLLEQSKQLASSMEERTEASLGLVLTYYKMSDMQRAEAEAQYILSFNSGSDQAREMLKHIRSAAGR